MWTSILISNNTRFFFLVEHKVLLMETAEKADVLAYLYSYLVAFILFFFSHLIECMKGQQIMCIYILQMVFQCIKSDSQKSSDHNLIAAPSLNIYVFSHNFFSFLIVCCAMCFGLCSLSLFVHFRGKCYPEYISMHALIFFCSLKLWLIVCIFSN